MQDTCLKKKENNNIQEDQESVCFKNILENLSTNRNRLIDIKNRLVFANTEEESERKELGVWGWWMQTITFRMDKQ